MIIITGKPGQLGNSLILYASFLAFSIENSIPVYNPSFYRYMSYFYFTSGKNKNIHHLVFNILYKYTRILVKLKSKKAKYIDWDENVNLDNPAELGEYTKLLFIQGWQFRGHETLKKHKEAIKNIFSPEHKLKIQLDSFINRNFNKNTETIIGLHIRRGDYNSFENGKYFYEISQYTEIIKKIQSIFINQSLHFLICSNEKLDETLFKMPNVKFTFGPGHELLDLYSFTHCHYLIGPPSTYTMWASFYGNVPLYMIHDINKIFTKADFKIQETL